MSTLAYYRWMLGRWAKGKRYIYGRGFSTRIDQDTGARIVRIMVVRTPFWVERIVAVSEFFCALTLHYYCNSIFGSVDRWADRHRRYFYLDSSEEEVVRWAEFAGMDPPSWIVEDPDDD